MQMATSADSLLLDYKFSEPFFVTRTLTVTLCLTKQMLQYQGFKLFVIGKVDGIFNT